VDWQLKTRALSLDRPRLMGIINVTPDSFSDGGRFTDSRAAVAHGLRLVEQGADLVDVGGESTRPGADPVGAAEELDRVLPVVAALAAEGVIVSVDTAKVEVARAALEAGAEIVNDVTGLADPSMRTEVAAARAGAVIMHMQGTPRTMQVEPAYGDVVHEVAAHLAHRAAQAMAAGVASASVVVDPGIGFGKTLAHNLALLAALDRIGGAHPVLLGVSRKSLFKTLLGVDDPMERDRVSATMLALAVRAGVRLFRVHDIESSLEAANLAWAIVRAQP
jgi:dihydropteroate synthase